MTRAHRPPLARATMAYAVDIRRVAIGALFDLRGARDAVGRALAPLGIELPAQPNTRSRHVDVDIDWIAPQRWLLRCAAERDLGAALAPLDRSLETSALEVTDACELFAIEGADAAAIIAQASPLDVHAAAFPPNGASFTEFFGQTALVARRSGGFSVLVDASYADFIEQFLLRSRG